MKRHITCMFAMIVLLGGCGSSSAGTFATSLKPVLPAGSALIMPEREMPAVYPLA